jgi:hypothetical protein
VLLLAFGSLAFAQVSTSGAATAAVGVTSKVASSDMGPGIESLKADAKEDYTVAAGDTLKAISAKVHGDYRYWPIVYMTNKETIANPEIIEPGMAVKMYKLPFNAADPNNLSKLLIVETYLQTYARYVELGGEWVGARRWVLLEATHFGPDLFDKSASRIEASDLEWHKAR